MLAASPMVVMRVSSSGVDYVSPNCAHVLGVAPEVAADPHYWELMAEPVALERMTSAIEAVLDGRSGPRKLDVPLGHGAERRYLSVTIAPYDQADQDDADRRYALVYILDRTGRREAERELRRSERQLRAVTTAVPDVITVFDGDMRVLWASASIIGAFGYRPADRKGRSAFDLVHPDDRPVFVRAVESVLAGRAEQFVECFRVRHANGKYLDIEARGRQLLGDDDEPAGVVVVSRDVSERARLESELREAKDAADSANHAKSEFLSRMSHELRTPLNVVLGFAQLLELDELDGERREWVGHILRAGRHLLDLINEVLDIARIESGNLSLSPEPVAVDDIIGEITDLLRPLAAAREVTFEIPLGEGLDVYVHADRQRLRQVLLNLVSNAVKYNRHGGLVTLRCEQADAADGLAGGAVSLHVVDTGIGISPEHLGRLFTPFDRLGAEQTATEGTGVGLALSLRLMQAMGGTLTADSLPGSGSTFTLTLPAAVPQQADDDGGADRLSVTGSASASEAGTLGGERGDRGDRGADLRPCTLLYIEDNISNVRLVERVLARRPSVRLLHAMQGGLGIDLARAHRPDLVLLDLHLPDMPGADVLRHLRTDDVTADIPVYIVSADATPGQIERMRDGGASGYLTKPLDVRRLLDLVTEVVARRAATGGQAG